VPPAEIVPEIMSVYSKLKAEVLIYINVIISEIHTSFLLNQTQSKIPTDNEKDYN
jgi:hypothetical protein